MPEFVEEKKIIPQGYGRLPKDQYQHQFMLLAPEDTELNTFSKICSKRMLLSNISNDAYMGLLQIDVNFLVTLFSMSRRDPRLVSLFKVRYYAWITELSITNAKDGLERRLQALVGTTYTPKDMMTGYGAEMQELEQEEQTLFDKAFNKFGGQKKEKPKNEGRWYG